MPESALGVPLDSAQRVLSRMEEMGMVDSERAGRAVVYIVNRSHVMWPVIESAINAPGGWMRW